MSVINLNYEQFSTTIKCYEDNIQKLTDNKNEIESIFNNLKTSWKGHTKEKFFSNLYKDLSKAMQDDINHLTFLKNELVKTRDAFNAVEQDYKRKLRINK